MTVEEGELIVLIGPSGSGKSTLLNILGGLDRPTAGHAWFHDLDLATATDAAITRFRRAQRRLRVPVLQPDREPDRARRTSNWSPKSPMSRCRAAEPWRWWDWRNAPMHFPAQLSGGEQQRVAIARAIAKRRTVLLCDEPTGALDVATGIRVLEAMVTVNRELRTTTLLITHNADIAQMGDRVVRFADGMIRSIERNAVSPARGFALVMRRLSPAGSQAAARPVAHEDAGCGRGRACSPAASSLCRDGGWHVSAHCCARVMATTTASAWRTWPRPWCARRCPWTGTGGAARRAHHGGARLRCRSAGPARSR